MPWAEIGHAFGVRFFGDVHRWQGVHNLDAKILPRIHQVLTDAGVPIPVICTPEELLGDDSETEA